MFKFSAEELKRLLDGIFAGTINPRNLPDFLYFSIANYLKEGIYKGFGIDFNKLTENINEGIGKFTTKDLELLTELRENVYMFSAAKTYQSTKEMSELLTGPNGLKTFPEFKAAALEIHEQYNIDWLETEHATAIGQAQMAQKWNDIIAQKEILPYVRFSVVEDANTTDICRPLDGIVVKIGDKMLDKYYPPNHWRCRTTVEQEDGSANPSSTHEVDKAIEHTDEHMPDSFKMNSGKDGVVFSPDHPYFDVAKKDKALASRNFDLPIPDKD